MIMCKSRYIRICRRTLRRTDKESFIPSPMIHAYENINDVPSLPEQPEYTGQSRQEECLQEERIQPITAAEEEAGTENDGLCRKTGMPATAARLQAVLPGEDLPDIPIHRECAEINDGYTVHTQDHISPAKKSQQIDSHASAPILVPEPGMPQGAGDCRRALNRYPVVEYSRKLHRKNRLRPEDMFFRLFHF